MRNLPKRHWEDGRHFRHNREHIHSLADCFTKPSAWAGAEATYRPLSANLHYFAGRSLFHNRLEAYHAVDAVVHLVSGLLLFLLCRQLLPGLTSVIPPLLFVSRRAHLQDIAYTSNFDTLSYAAFSLAGLHLFVRARRAEQRAGEVLAVACFGLALLCKEAAIVWPALVTVYGWLFDRSNAWRKYIAAWVVAATWAVAYRLIVQGMYPAAQPWLVFDWNPAGLLSRYAAYLLSFLNALVPNVDPEKAGWAMPPAVSALAATPPSVALMACLVIAELALICCCRWRPASLSQPVKVAVFGFAWFLAATAPFVIFADRLFIRYSYFGHAGLAIAAGGVTAAIVARARVLERGHAARWAAWLFHRPERTSQHPRAR